MSVRLLTSCFVSALFFMSVSAVCTFTSVILGILTYPVTCIQDTHYPHLNWKPNIIFMALESWLSAVSVCCFREYSKDCSSLEMQVNVFLTNPLTQLLPPSISYCT